MFVAFNPPLIRMTKARFKDVRWFAGAVRKRYVRINSAAVAANRPRLRLPSVPAALSVRLNRFRQRMFRSAAKSSGKNGSTGSGGSAGTPSPTPSNKGKTWRRIKPSIGRKISSAKASSSPTPSPPSPSDGGFLPLKMEVEANAEEKAPPPKPEEPIEDMMVPMSPPPPPPPCSATQAGSATTPERPVRPARQPRSTTRRTPIPTLPAFPAFPTLPPLPVRQPKKKSSGGGGKSEPALNVYLQQRQVVSGSKFRQADMQQQQEGEPEPKMSRYQKLARDTKNLVARLSGGEIPSPEKIRQALKMPPASSSSRAGTSGEKVATDAASAKQDVVVPDVTDPEFTCDEQTAAILLAELERDEGKATASSGVRQEEASPPPPPPPLPPPNSSKNRKKSPPPISPAAQPQQQRQQQQQKPSPPPLGDDDVIHYGSSPEPEYCPITAQRFAQLRSLYRSLERLNQLERSVSGNELNRLASSDGVIDFDLWRRIRQAERAREEMRHLATWIQAAQREGECFFSTSPPSSGSKWAGNDPGLRIKDQSVRDLTDKFTHLSESPERQEIRPDERPQRHEQLPLYSTQSLPRNFTALSRPGSVSPASERPSRSSQRRCSLTGQQMAELKSQLARVYANKSEATSAKPQGADAEPARTPRLPDHKKLYVRSNSESSRDLTLARLEERRARLLASQKALSIASGGQSDPSPSTIRRSQSLSEAERRNLSARLSAEVKRRHQSTRTAIQYVQQLSQNMSSQLRTSSSGRSSAADRTRSSSRESSASSNQDYLLVLTPRVRDHAEVASVVQEWADTQRPALPKRSSSLRADDSNSSNSSVQTVIQRDVQQKVDFFEKVIADSSIFGDPTEGGVVPFRPVSKSVSDLRRSSSSIVSRRRSGSCATSPQRSHSLSLHRPGSSAAGSAADLRFSQLMERLRTPSPSPSAKGHYLTLVKAGDVGKKCQYFARQSSCSPVRRQRPEQQQQQQQLPQQQHAGRQPKRSVTPISSRSAPDLLGDGAKFNRNKTVIKGQEMGDVSFIKRRYEQRGSSSSSSPLRPASGRYSQSTPTLAPGWRARLAAAASRKQVSFPFMFNKTGRTGNGKKLDFTRVKPTLLSSARLAFRQAQTAANPHLQHTHVKKNSAGSRATETGSASDIASTIAKTVASPPISVRSASQGSVCSRRSMTSPLPPIPVTSSTASATSTTAAPSKATPAVENDYAPVGNGSSTAASTACPARFDPALHQPTYRYTPPPPRTTSTTSTTTTSSTSTSTSRPANRSVYDLYATYPRRPPQQSCSAPSRPPLPTDRPQRPGG